MPRSTFTLIESFNRESLLVAPLCDLPQHRGYIIHSVLLMNDPAEVQLDRVHLLQHRNVLLLPEELGGRDWREEAPRRDGVRGNAKAAGVRQRNAEAARRSILRGFVPLASLF